MEAYEFFLNELNLRKEEARFKISEIIKNKIFSQTVEKLLIDSSFLNEYLQKNNISKCFEFTELDESKNELQSSAILKITGSLDDGSPDNSHIKDVESKFLEVNS